MQYNIYNNFFTGAIKDEVENIINVEEENSLDNFTDDITHLTETASNNNWKEWLQIIEHEIEEESKNATDRPNAYCNMQFTKIIKKDILLLPLWTKLLETKISYGSTGGSTASC